MNKTIVLLLFTICFSTFAEEAYITQMNKSSFNFTLKENGQFELTHQVPFKASLSLTDIFFKGFYNSTIVKSFDSSIESISYKNLPKRADFTSDFYKPFSVTTVGSKNGKSSTIKMNCAIKKSSSSLMINCNVDKNSGSGNKLFYSYNNSLTCNKSITCSCSMTSKGKIKKQQLLWIKRSSHRLAISASVEVLRSNSFIAAYLNGKKTNTVYSVEKSKYFTQNIEPFWPELTDKLNSKQEISRELKAESTSNGILISY